MKSLTRLIPLVLLAALLAVPAHAKSIKDMPGYIDLSWIEIPDYADEVQDIDLGPVLLNVAADAEKAGDDQLAKALSMIKSIRVKAFSSDRMDVDEVQKMIRRVSDELKRNDWERLVYIKDKGESLTVSTKYEDGDMVGLMIVAYEADEDIAFVNVVGNLDLATLMRLGLGLDDIDLDELMENLENNRDD